MNTQTMKLGTRLGLAFLAMLMLTVAVGGFALSRLSQVNASTVEIATNWLPSIKMLGEIRATANQIRRVEADHLMAETLTEMDGMEKRMAELKAVLDEKQRAYEAVVSPGDERARYEAFKQARARYFEIQGRLIAISRGGERNADQAKTLFRGDSRNAFNEMAGDLGKLVEINDQGSQAAASTAESNYRSALWWTLGLVGLAIVVAAALGVWITRSITRQLGGEPADAAALARRVADGDLSAAIALRPGDTASLMAALKRMQDSLSAIVLTVRGGAEGVATASAQISQGTTDLSSRTEEQASALEQTSASMKELATTVNQNAANAQEGNRLAVEASGVASRGGEVVRQVVADGRLTASLAPCRAGVFLIAVPTGVKIFNWIATMWKGALSFETPMLFAAGFIFVFTIGGFSGLILAISPIDIQMQDTYYVIAHFHYVLVAGSLARAQPGSQERA